MAAWLQRCQRLTGKDADATRRRGPRSDILEP